ncbi:alpha/beta fold hydrolase [Streptomyces sp. NPDC051940]|uniref:alpha/beta fold hydrolase n=1 Tax=Streptomyces sp. NPDC051940 TaxID=3155675 RepID=UPI003412E6CB
MLEYERTGSGEPLVLLHGIGHRRQAWEPVIERLAAEREVILVDLPGHGGSGRFRPGGRPPLDAMRAQLTEFMAEQKLDRPHIAGNSLGGWIALDIAAAGGARSVTALSPAGFWSSYVDVSYTGVLFTVMQASAALVAPIAPQMVRSAFGRWVLMGWIAAKPSRLSPERALGDFRAFRRAAGTVFRFLRAGGKFKGGVPAGVPVSIAWAGHDVVLPRYQRRRARRLLPQAEHHLLEGCGHVPMSDDPERVAELILRGSASVEPSQDMAPARPDQHAD